MVNKKSGHMKKVITILCVVVLACLVMPVQGQLRFGIKGGVNISTVHFSSDIIDPSNVTGFHIGPMIEASIPLMGVGFDAALLYSQKGMEVGPSGLKEAIKVDYIDLPVHLKWKFGLPIVKAYLATGPYFGFRVSGDKFWDVPGNVVSQVKAKTFGMGWDFGVGAEVLNHLQIGINYGLGLTNNYSIGDEGGGKNRGWMITAAILF